MVDVTFLGVGGAMTRNPADNFTALLVDSEPWRLLLDCGPSIMVQLERAGITAGDPTHIYLSHQHGDHLLGLPMLLLNRVLFWPERPLVVMAEPRVLALARQLVTIAYPDVLHMADGTVEFVELDSESATPLPGTRGDIRCSLAPGRHSVPTWALRLDFPTEQSLLYTSDTGVSAPIAALARDVTLLIHECYYAAAPEVDHQTHSVAGDVASTAEAARAGALALVHRKDPELAARESYRQAIAQGYSGTTLIPMAGDRFRLG